MKIGISRRLSEAREALRLFDYVEAWDLPLKGQAHHLVRGKLVDPKNHLYVVNHITWEHVLGALVENLPGTTFDQAKTYIETMNEKFLLDIGHAYLSDRFYGDGRFSLERWLSLSPVAVHLHNVKEVMTEHGKDHIDHQPLSAGIMDMKLIVKRLSECVEYLTLEIMFDGPVLTDYSSQWLRGEMDRFL